MKLSSFRYVGPQSIKSMLNNGWMTIAAVVTITIAIFLCAMFWALLVNVGAAMQDVEEDVRVMVYIDYDATATQQEELRSALDKLPGVADISFVSKAQGLASLEVRFGYEDLQSTLGGVNPLPDMYSITAAGTEYVANIAAAAEKLDHVYTVRYGADTVEKLFKLSTSVENIGYVLMVLIGVCAIVLISMATRLTIQARKREIMVMKWTGATNAFIRWPFVLEGMILGLVGAVLALALMLVLYSRAEAYMAMNLSFLSLLPLSELWGRATIFTLSAGLVLGALGSLIPLRKMMDV